MPVDLSDAIFEGLRNNIQVVQAFGDTWNPILTLSQNNAAGNVCKFFADYAAQVDLPFIVEMEPRETYQNMTQAPSGLAAYIADGQLQLVVLADDRRAARELGELVIVAMEDMLIAWPGSNPMNLRINSAGFVPRPGIGPGVPTVFQRILTFDYEYSGSRSMPLPGVPQ